MQLKILSVSDDCLLKVRSSNINALIAGNNLTINVEKSVIWGALLGNEVALDKDSLLHYPYQLADREKMVGYAGVSLMSAGAKSGSSVALGSVLHNLTPGQGKPFVQDNPLTPPGPPGAIKVPFPGGGQPPVLPPDPPPPTGGGGGGGGGSMAMALK